MSETINIKNKKDAGRFDGRRAWITWEVYWKNRRINWKDSYFNIDHPHRKLLIDILKNDPPGSVCEVGCASGANLWNIKKEFPNCKIAGCDVSLDAIETAKEIFFGANLPKTGEQDMSQHPNFKNLDGLIPKELMHLPNLTDIEFKVGAFDAIPFHGESYDLILTDAALMYVCPQEMARALREIRRIGYKRMIFIELHSTNWFKRKVLNLGRHYWAYNYFQLLRDSYFKHVECVKIPYETWPHEPWKTFGYIISCYR